MLWNEPHHQSLTSKLALHDHVAFLCGRPEHLGGLASSFFREGLNRNQRCLYLHGLYRPQQMYLLLDHEGLPVGDARQSDHLALEAATDFFLAKGYLDAEDALAKLCHEVEKTLAAGCSGLRLLVDMNWATYLSSGMVDLLACERLLNDVFLPRYPCLAVCHYERVLFPPNVLKMVPSQHDSVLDGDHFVTFPAPPARNTMLGGRLAHSSSF